MLYIKYSFVFLLSAASVVLATVAQIEQQLGFVSSNSTNWNNLLNAFPATGGSATAVLQILVAGQNFAESLATVAELTTANGPLSSDDAVAILDLVSPCGLTLENSLSTIVTMKPLLIATPLGTAIQPVFLTDLKNLNATGIGFASSFIGVAPGSLLSIEVLIEADVSKALAAAIAAYS